MKTQNRFLWVCAVLLLFSGSCRKYEDGPGFSLLSKTQRLCNSWRPELVTRNGQDITLNFLNDNYVEEYRPDGYYGFSSYSASGSGQWSWNHNKTIVNRFGIDNQPSRSLIILRLKEKSLWYYYMDGNDRVEFHFVPN